MILFGVWECVEQKRWDNAGHRGEGAELREEGENDEKKENEEEGE